MNMEKARITHLPSKADQKNTALIDQPTDDPKQITQPKGLKWVDLIKPAKRKWTRLSDLEISGSNGDAKILTELIKQNYGVSTEAVNREIVDFFNHY